MFLTFEMLCNLRICKHYKDETFIFSSSCTEPIATVSKQPMIKKNEGREATIYLEPSTKMPFEPIQPTMSTHMLEKEI